MEHAVPPPARDLAPPPRSRERRRRADHAPDQERAGTPEPVVAVHGTIVPVRIATFGDVMLDVIVRLERPLAAGDDVRAQTRACGGGQAANVAAWAAALGAEARCVAKRGDDVAGELVARELAARGVELVGPIGEGATGVVVSLVGADGDRSLASDRGVAPSFAADELEARWLDCDVLHVSGYALLREPISHAALLAVQLARDLGAQVSVDVAAWTEIRAFGPVLFRELLDTIAPDVLFATEAEWEMLGGAYLTAPTGVIKRGARGCTVVTSEARLDLAPVEADVVDTTGAGDALAAGFLLGGSLEQAARRGLDAAARCVARVGSLP
jgi:sugar/nucleoside kinase (ribokinase family)